MSAKVGKAKNAIEEPDEEAQAIIAELIKHLSSINDSLMSEFDMDETEDIKPTIIKQEEELILDEFVTNHEPPEEKRSRKSKIEVKLNDDPIFEDENYKTGLYECDRCKKVLTTLRRFQNHRAGCQGDNKKCPHCRVTLSCANYMKVHLRKVHGVNTTPEGFPCDICGQTFTPEWRLRTHRIKCLKKSQLKFFCDHCEKVFTDKDNLRAHVMGHAIHKVACKVCGAKIRPRTVADHMYKFHPEVEDRFECKECSKFFLSAPHLHAHMRCHNKRFKCEVCGIMFVFKCQLEDHMKFHNNPELFKCKICGHQAKSRSNFIGHSKVHAKDEERKYECDECDYKTNHKGKFAVHTNSHRFGKR